MSKKKIQDFKPFLSLLIIITSLFVVVFFKMEMRRLNYSLVKKTRGYSKLADVHQLKKMTFARLSRLERVRNIAVTRLTLEDAKEGQIIQLTGDKIAIYQ